jgi:DNA ligase-1
MLAAKLESLSDIVYPVLCTPKLDGIRALKIGGRLLSRSFKPIPNDHVRDFVEKNFPDGVDGELMIEGGTFQEATHAVMSVDGTPDVTYFIFDYAVEGHLQEPYRLRMKRLEKLHAPKGCSLVLPIEIKNKECLLAYEERCLAEGYEGVMLRSPDGPYKCGRSTSKEGYLLKLKRFSDAEAVVVGYEEKMHNANEAKKDAFGRTERSSHKENLVPVGTLGALIVKSKDFTNEFNIGTGFNDAQRDELWKTRDTLKGKIVTFKFQPYGVKDVPRFPVFLAFRDKRDIS